IFHLNTKFLRCYADGFPAHFGVGAENLSFNESDLAMAEALEMIERQSCRFAMVQGNIGHSREMPVAGNGDDGHGNSGFAESIDQDQTLDGTLLQQAGIFLDQIIAVAMTDDEIKITFLQKVIFDARENERGIAFADFRDDDTDRETTLLAQHAGQIAGPIM